MSFGYGDTDISDARGATTKLRSKMGALYGSYAEPGGSVSMRCVLQLERERTRRCRHRHDDANGRRELRQRQLRGRRAVELSPHGECAPLMRPFAELFYDQIDGARFSERDAGAGNSPCGSTTAKDCAARWSAVRERVRRFRAHVPPVLRSRHYSSIQGQSIRNRRAAVRWRRFVPRIQRGAGSHRLFRQGVLEHVSWCQCGVSIGYTGEIADNYSQHEANLAYGSSGRNATSSGAVFRPAPCRASVTVIGVSMANAVEAGSDLHRTGYRASRGA